MLYIDELKVYGIERFEMMKKNRDKKKRNQKKENFFGKKDGENF
jgi:hypothetical protein